MSGQVETDARAIVSVALGLSVPIINITAPMLPFASPQSMHAFVEHLRALATAVETQAKTIDGTAIDDVIERSKRP